MLFILVLGAIDTEIENTQNTLTTLHQMQQVSDLTDVTSISGGEISSSFGEFVRG